MKYELIDRFFEAFPNPGENIPVVELLSLVQEFVPGATRDGLVQLMTVAAAEIGRHLPAGGTGGETLPYEFVEDVVFGIDRFREEEVVTLLTIPGIVVAIPLRDSDELAHLVAIGTRTVPGPMSWVAERIRLEPNTVVYAVSGYAPLVAGELAVAQDVTMRVRPHWAHSFHDTYVEAFSITFTFAADVDVMRTQEYVRTYLPRFTTFARGRELAARFDVSRRADAR